MLNSAEALGTKIVRVWPGMNKSSDSFTNEEYEKYVADAKRICALAEKRGVSVALECHPNSLSRKRTELIRF